MGLTLLAVTNGYQWIHPCWGIRCVPIAYLEVHNRLMPVGSDVVTLRNPSQVFSQCGYHGG